MGIIYGLGEVFNLKQIKATGSISQGAKMAGISYKSAWDAINEMNQLADELLT